MSGEVVCYMGTVNMKERCIKNEGDCQGAGEAERGR